MLRTNEERFCLELKFGFSKTKENKDNVSNMMLGKYWSSGDILRKWCS